MPSRTGGGGTTSVTMVTGTHRYKYFKRPIMPRVNAYPPQILLAPNAEGENNPLVPVDIIPESATKEAGIQTMYRESEAQTLPYTPQFVVPAGQDPEIVLLKNLTYEEGLPLGKKEIEMIEYARGKKDMEVNLPPFTDEASLNLRKRLMEEQEMREFKMRENEIDQKRHNKVSELSQALHDREESNEFMASQRLESIRLLRLEEREKVLERIRHKRIKALRRIAHERNESDPVLSDGKQRDIINDYFDRGSKVYAPVKRDGRPFHGNEDHNDISSRTVPLDSIGNIVSLEYTIPKKLMNTEQAGVSPALLSKTAPPGAPLARVKEENRIRAAEPRMTSAAQRNLRMTKRDVEEMHHILQQKKHNSMGLSGAMTPQTRGSRPQSPQTMSQSASSPAKHTSLLSKKPKGRPPTPDLTQERNQLLLPPPPAPTHEFEEVQAVEVPDVSPHYFDHEFQLATILLQRLIRGRAVQNIMFEGKYRRRELINELKASDEAEANFRDPDANEIDQTLKAYRAELLRETTLDAVAGSTSSNLLTTLAQEKVSHCCVFAFTLWLLSSNVFVNLFCPS